MIADLTSENAIVVIEFLTVVIEIFYLGPGQKGRAVPVFWSSWRLGAVRMALKRPFWPLAGCGKRRTASEDRTLSG